MKMKTTPFNRWLTCSLTVGLALLSVSARAGSPSIWNGGGGDNSWSSAANWGDNVPVPDVAYDLEFGGTTRLTPVNDFPALSNFRNITFNAGAGAFTVTGSSIRLNGSIANNSASPQILNVPIATTPGRANWSISGAISTTNNWTNYSRLYITSGTALRKSVGLFAIAPTAGTSGSMEMSGGSFTNTTVWGFNNFLVGGIGYGSLIVSGGTVDTHGFMIASYNSSAAVGVATISGGLVAYDDNVAIPYYAGSAVLTVSDSGTLKRSTGVKAFNINQNGNGRGEVNLLGGTIDNGGGVVGLGTGTGTATGGSGILNLNAGSFTTARFNPARGFSRLNFNGGTLRPSSAQAAFVPATFTSVNVNGPFGAFVGGAAIDTAGYATTIAASLSAPTGEGVSDIPVTDGSSGYIGAPYVLIADAGTGTGATAIANMVDDGTGNGTLKVDSLKITNPGVDYSAATITITLKGGGAATSAVTGAVTTAPNTSGGLTKLGAGTLTLGGVNTYTGPTIVSAGVLAVDGSLAAGSVVTVADGGSLAGIGTVGGPVTLAAGGSLAPGNGIGTLTLGGNLTLNEGGTIAFDITDAFTADKLVVGGTLNPTGKTTIVVPGLTPLADGDYTLMEVTGTLGGDGSRFSATSPSAAKSYTVVYQPGAPNKVVLRVGPNTSLLTWTGNAGAAWNLSPGLNWQNLGGLPAAFQDNVPVVFDDTGAGNPQVNITAAVSPSDVSVTAYGDYTFAGAGQITGAGTLHKIGSGALTLSNANTFSGGVFLSGGALNLSHAAAPGTGKLSILGGTLDNTSGSALTLANNNPQAWDGDFAFTGTSDLNLGTGLVTAGANRTITANARTLTVGGAISGTGGITKAGAGKLVLAGANTYGGGTTNSYGNLALAGSLINSSGAMVVEGGATTLSGPVETGAGTWVAGGAGRGQLNLAPGAAITKSGSLYIGFAAGSGGAVNINGGTFTNLSAWSFTNFSIGVSGYGAVTVSGAQVDTRGFIMGSGSAGGAIGMMTISDATVLVDNHVVIPYYASTSVLTVATNGVLRRTAGAGNLNLNQKGSGRGELNLMGGIVDNGNGFMGFGTGSSPGTGGAGILNLDAGTFTIARFNPTSYGSSHINFNGGTLRAYTNRTDFMPALMSSVCVNGPFGSFTGGAIIDTAGFNNTIDASLVAPAGEGVRALAVIDSGVGYIGAPYVSIMDSGTGAGATAIANMVDDGTGNGTLKVASIKVTNPGVDYTAATASFTLTGGMPLSPAQPGTVTTAPNTSGGLTKLGAGILTLSGTNTYTGPTLVNAGGLAVNGWLAASGAVTVTGGSLGGTGVISGPVTVQSGGILAPGTSIGTLTISNTLTLSAGSTTSIELDKSANSSDLVGADTLHYGGKLSVTNLAGALAAGDTFKLFSTAAHTGTFSQITVSGGTATFDAASGVLTITGTMADYPTNMSFSFSSGNLALSWPETHKGWYAQSNAVNVADGLSWFDIPGSASVTSLGISVDSSAPQVFYRLRQP